jgi:hypothetical protein
MFKKLIALSAFGLLLAPAMTRADHHDDRTDFPGLDAGTWELTLTGAGTSNQDIDAGTFSVQGSLGYFIFDQFELLGRQSIGYADTDTLDGGGTVVTATSSIGIDYHFDLDRFQPFIGAAVGYNYGSSEIDETWFAGPEAGLKYFVKDDTFLYGLIQYQWFWEDSDSFTNNADDGGFLYAVGIGFTW